MLGADFLLNGAVFAQIYQDGNAFLLPPTEAFRRIPLGYLAFLLVAVVAVELSSRLDGGGIKLGLLIGAAAAAVWSLSLWSITTISVEAGIAFAVIWLVLFVVAFSVAGYGRAQRSLRRLSFAVAGFDVLCVVLVVALQSLDVVPAIRV